MIWSMAQNPEDLPTPTSGLWLLILVLAFFPGVAADDDGNNFTNNLMTDLAPLLTLFGERVTQQFLSGSMGITDCIMFAVGPLGIITAIVSAIRCGGPPILNAIIGRGREGRGIVEVELLSSTSEDVVELWNGSGIVRILGKGDVLQLVYIDPTAKHGDTEENIIPDNEVDIERLVDISPKTGSLEIYDFTQAINRSIISSAHGESLHHVLPQTTSNVVSPNISLNIGGQKSSEFERYSVAALGVFLQLGAIAYAGAGTYSRGLKEDFLHDKKSMPGYAFPLMAGGTMIMVLGMFLCARVVDQCTSEVKWVVPGHENRSLKLAWLQKGGKVNDQHFDSYLIRPHGVPLVANQEPKRSRFKNLFKFRQRPRQFIITSRRNERNQYSLTWLATVASLLGYASHFLGLRFSHYSVTLVQLGVTVIMTGLRAFVRRSMIREPDHQEVAPGYELEWMAKSVLDCKLWNPVSRVFQEPRAEVSRTLATNVFEARRRLGELVTWRESNDCEQTIGEIANAITTVMSIFSSRRRSTVSSETDDESSWDILDRFEWTIPVEVADNDCARLEEVILSVSREMLGPSSEIQERSWGPWMTSTEDLKCFLRLWLMELHTRGRPAKGTDPFNAEMEFQNLSIFTIDEEFNSRRYEEYGSIREPERSAPLFSKKDAPRSKPPDSIVAIPCRLEITCSINWLGYLSDKPVDKLCGQFIVNQLIFALVCDEAFRTSDSETGKLSNELIHDLIKALTMGLATIGEAYLSVVEALNSARGSPAPIPTGSSDSASIKVKNNDMEGNSHDSLPQSNSLGNQDTEQWEPVDWCIWLNSAGALEELDGCLEENKEKQNILNKACQIGRPDMARFAVGLGADVHAENDLALSLAARGGHEAVIRLLLDRGAKIHADRDVALRWAAEGGHEAVVRILLDRGAAIHADDDFAFRWAAGGGHEAVVRLLLDRGVDSHADGDAALRWAASEGHEAVVRLLLDRGADIHAYGDAALYRAAGGGHEAMVRLLLDRGADIPANRDMAIRGAAKGGHEAVARLLLDRGADIHTDGDVALRGAAKGGHEAVVRFLLDRGADIHAEDDFALRWAAEGGHEAVARLLLERGADIHVLRENSPLSRFRTRLQGRCPFILGRGVVSGSSAKRGLGD